MQKYNISVVVQSKFLPEQSDIEDDKFAFCYTITISNEGTVGAKLLRRYWLITNAEGEEHEVEGEGVVGEQPLLMPGESFRYTSGAIIDTPVGSMQGSYDMISQDGTQFEAVIEPFTLAMPELVH